MKKKIYIERKWLADPFYIIFIINLCTLHLYKPTYLHTIHFQKIYLAKEISTCQTSYRTSLIDYAEEMEEDSFLPRAACYSFCHTSCRCQHQIPEDGVRQNLGYKIQKMVVIDETSGSAIRSLISYEHCRTGCSPAITSYAVLLDILINTNEDLVNLMHICCFCSTISNEAYMVLFGRKNTESFTKLKISLSL